MAEALTHWMQKQHQDGQLPLHTLSDEVLRLSSTLQAEAARRREEQQTTVAAGAGMGAGLGMGAGVGLGALGAGALGVHQDGVLGADATQGNGLQSESGFAGQAGSVEEAGQMRARSADGQALWEPH